MPSAFEELDTLARHDPDAALRRLEDELRQRREYQGLFHALLLRARLKLGLPAVHSGKADDIPAPLQAPYEDAIREAGRTVGQLYLDDGDLAAAWPYFRMLGEPGPVAAALERGTFRDEQFPQALEIALNEGVHP